MSATRLALLALVALLAAAAPGAAAPAPLILESGIRCSRVQDGRRTRSVCTVWREEPAARRRPAYQPPPVEQRTPARPRRERILPRLDSRPQELPYEAIPDELFADNADIPDEAPLLDEAPLPFELRRLPQRRALAPRSPTPRSPALGLPAPSPPAAPADATVSSTTEAHVLALLNQERRRRGLQVLRLDRAASAVARAHSRDMCERRYFDHAAPDGSKPWDRLRNGGLRFKGAAENIAVGYTDPVEVHDGWMQSPGHRNNRLGAHYGRAGVGLYFCNGRTAYWTELFLD